MILQVCADESYAINSKGTGVIAVAGWLSRPDNFKGFCDVWAAVLKAYDAPYFHFKEFADKNHKNHDTTPYDDWPDLKRENFLYDLALVACEVGAPVGGCLSLTETGTQELSEYNIWRAYVTFLLGVCAAMKRMGRPDDTVEFILDINEDRKWNNSMEDAIKTFKDAGIPFGGWTQKDDKVFAPLQAADLYAYAMRQNGERFYKLNRQPGQPQLLDLILEKNRHDMENWQFNPENWGQLMRKVIEHKREWKKQNPSDTYYPLIHCPLLQDNGKKT